VLALVHSSKGSGVDYGVELGALEGSSHKAEIGDVDLGQIRANHLMARPEVCRKVPTQHPVAACNQDTHSAFITDC
jgi:hypothetical protein